jgi:uncharacterized protein (UPF0548 family)
MSSTTHWRAHRALDLRAPADDPDVIPLASVIVVGVAVLRLALAFNQGMGRGVGFRILTR